MLYVNINSLHKISKYTGKEGTTPKVNKLGSDAWEKLKNKTKKQVKDIAADLIKLYANRKASQGFRHTPDSYLTDRAGSVVLLRRHTRPGKSHCRCEARYGSAISYGPAGMRRCRIRQN
ncbi:MAG: CarD family transcriptional regulator [Chitinophagaceae bacterium]